jgi:hypothetical protein
MCLMVYLGVDEPITGADPATTGQIGLDPDVRYRPTVLAAKKCIYRVADLREDGWNCSCIFRHRHMDWEPEDAEMEVRAFDRLETIVAAAEHAGVNPVIFSCWAGEEEEAAVIHWRLPADRISKERYLFGRPETEGGTEDPALIQIDSRLDRAIRNVL